jgi:hypothetical protein
MQHLQTIQTIVDVNKQGEVIDIEDLLLGRITDHSKHRQLAVIHVQDLVKPGP